MSIPFLKRRAIFNDFLIKVRRSLCSLMAEGANAKARERESRGGKREKSEAQPREKSALPRG